MARVMYFGGPGGLKDTGVGSFYFARQNAKDRAAGRHRMWVQFPSKSYEGGSRWMLYLYDDTYTDVMVRLFGARHHTWNGDFDHPTLSGEVIYLGRDRGWDNPEFRGHMAEGVLVDLLGNRVED